MVGGGRRALSGLLLIGISFVLHSKLSSAAEEMCGVAHCASCGEGPLQCTECSQSPFSYMLTDNQRCNRCPNNCKRCHESFCSSEPGTCIECNDGYYHVESLNTCNSCTMSGCRLCSSINTCTECHPGYYLDGSVCSRCPSNSGVGQPCSMCQSSAMCDVCITGYYKTGDTRGCQVCPSGCTDCEETGKMHRNSNNFLVCKSCHNTRKYIWNTPSHNLQHPVCMLCGGNCASCEENNPDRCITCMEGYYLTGSRTCQACQVTGCKQCVTATTCTTCHDGRYKGLGSTTCMECSSIHANCTRCTNSGTPTCIECDDGYFVVGGSCRMCDRLSEDECNVCKRDEYGYTWDISATNPYCKSCPMGCSSCFPNGTCSECSTGYYLTGSTCTGLTCSSLPSLDSAVKCSACEKYWDGSSCSNCPSPLTSITNDKNKCMSCHGVWEGTCKAINCTAPPSDQNECNLCAGKRWDTSGSSCIDCHGAMIDTTPDCTNCKGHSMRECKFVECAGTIESSGSRCQKCIGRKWESSACHALNCADRTLLNSVSDCEGCPGNHFDGAQAAGARCTQCTPNCKKCQSGSACETCMDGYYVSGGSCVAADCISNPLSLTAAPCTACPGRKHDGTNCVLLSVTDCTSPPDAATCTACRAYGYVWDGSSCSQPCMVGDVVNTEAKCTMCSSQRWVSGECQVNTYGEVVMNPIMAAVTYGGSVDDSASNCLHAPHHYFVAGKCRSGQCDNLKTLNIAECASCGYFWNSGSCETCTPANCEECDAVTQTTCALCAAGFKSSGANCVIATCSPLPTLVADCRACPATVWKSTPSTCHAVTDSSTAATHCPDADEATCSRTCTEYGYYYDSTSTTCTLCPMDQDLHNADQCGYCKKNYYVPELACLISGQDYSQNGMPGVTCSGAISDSYECTMCKGRMWSGSQCEAVSCHDISALNTQTKCEACMGFFWDTSECKRCPHNCDICTDESTCTQCRETYILNSGDCEKPDHGCHQLNPSANQHDCETCPGRYVTGGSCVAITETDCVIDATVNLCRACRLYGYIHNTTHCVKECTEGALLDDEYKCTKCPHVKWDDSSSSCQATMMSPQGGGFSIPLTISSMGDATSCYGAEREWQENCEPFDCNIPATRMTQSACQYCLNKKWNSAMSQCEDMTPGDCTDSQMDSTTCNKCSGMYWDDTWMVCRDFLQAECASGGSQHYQTQARCNACSRKDDPATAAHMWQEDIGMCQECSDSLSRRTSCEYCPGQWWQIPGGPGIESCTDCHADCTECHASDNCTKCVHGKILADNQCSDSCLFSGKEECESCDHAENEESYWKTASTPNECFLCTEPFDAHSCYTCSGGTKYWNSGTSTCVACGTSCASCTASGCSACKPGYYPTGSTPVTCTNCASGCAACTSATQCQTCSPSYCLDVDADSCISIGNNGHCDRCYLKDGQVKCIDCKGPAYLRQCDVCKEVHCISCPQDRHTCAKCDKNYYLDGTQCLSCGEGCSDCHESNGCQDCNDGYYESDVGSSVTCTRCDVSHCSSCPAAANTCTACATGYHLENNQCLPCGEGCSQCNPTNGCQSCSEGYYTSTGGAPVTCTRCSASRCKSCPASHNTCTECTANYYLASSNQCQYCGHGCLQCDQSNGCESCREGYYSNGGSPVTCTSCISSINHCTECTSSGNQVTCKKCGTGYHLANNTCQTCSSVTPACSECSPKPKCATCDPGYTLENERCVPTCKYCRAEGLECNLDMAENQMCSGILKNTHACRTVVMRVPQKHTFHKTSEAPNIVFRGCFPLIFGLQSSDCDNSTRCSTKLGIKVCSACCMTTGCNMHDADDMLKSTDHNTASFLKPPAFLFLSLVTIPVLNVIWGTLRLHGDL